MTIYDFLAIMFIIFFLIGVVLRPYLDRAYNLLRRLKRKGKKRIEDIGFQNA